MLLIFGYSLNVNFTNSVEYKNQISSNVMAWLRGCFFVFFLVFISCKKEKKQVEACLDEKVIDNNHTVEGYADRVSYFPGDNVVLYIHSLKEEIGVSLINLNDPSRDIFRFSNIKVKKQNYTSCSFMKGCLWDKSFEFELPANLASGYYSINLLDGENKSAISFIVKENNPSKEIVVLASTNTWQAYNAWGGASFYKYLYNHPDNIVTSPNVSYLRPNPTLGEMDASDHLLGREIEVSKWLEENSFGYRVISDLDLHESIESIKNSKILVLNTHPEYWSEAMYNNLNSYMKNGGNLIYLGGNGIYWKVTVKEDQLEVRKEGKLVHVHDGTKGGRWRDVGRPESALLGVQYDRAGYNTYHPFRVKKNDSWIFNETGLVNGQLFGEKGPYSGASGKETDKVTEYSPKNIVFLAEGTNKEAFDEIGKDKANKRGGANMIYYQHPGGGEVFSVGSIAYGSFLRTDSTISNITQNVFNHFLGN